MTMKGSHVRTAALFLSLIQVAAACSSYHGPTVAGVSERMTAELHSGDPEYRVKAVLNGLGVSFCYNEFDNRFEGTIPESRHTEGGIEGVILVHAYLNADGSFRRFTVQEILTFI